VEKSCYPGFLSHAFALGTESVRNFGEEHRRDGATGSGSKKQIQFDFEKKAAEMFAAMRCDLVR
jgi:hypothetical protein